MTNINDVDSSNGDYSNFQKLLDNQYSWPARYCFKFIVPSESVLELKNYFQQEAAVIKEKSTSSGRYVSISIELMQNSSNEIIQIYQLVKNIKGLICL